VTLTTLDGWYKSNVGSMTRTYHATITALPGYACLEVKGEL